MNIQVVQNPEGEAAGFVKAWVTSQFFSEWVKPIFEPAVKKYFLENDIPLKALRNLNNAPAYPPNYKDILDKFKFIKILYLSHNTTPILHPMDQQVASNFKKLYIKHLFCQCFELIKKANLIIREFWKEQYNIDNCLKIMDVAWQGVTRRMLNFA